MKTNKFLIFIFLSTGLILLSINLFGLFQDLRPDGLTPDVLRFKEDDVKLTRQELFELVQKKDSDSDFEYATRSTLAIADGLAHPEWEVYHPDLFHQRVPIWENYILYWMGVFTNIKEFKRYHFSNPEKSLTRGIGICGDASMTLSGLLDRHDIANKIVTVPGHVMVQATIDDTNILLDADYGIVFDEGIEFYKNNPSIYIEEFQRKHGKVNDGELVIAKELESRGFRLWNGRQHFITKKYYFEYFSYFAKWAIPVLLIVVGLQLIKNGRRDV